MKIVVIIFISFLLGIISASFYWSMTNNHLKQTVIKEEVPVTTNHDMHSMSNTMNGMVGSLEGKTGDAFDRVFINEMIVHHQGAIDMAKLGIVNAKHPEIKQLSQEIIDAQTGEIEKMNEWKMQWSY